MRGFHGCYWRYDLTRGEGRRIPIPEEILVKTLGGVGLGAWLLHLEAPVGVDPFAPEAPLIFSFSPLVGTGLTTSAKFAVVAKSPLTGGVCDALASSHFAIAGKRMGIDALVFVGACAEPSEWVKGELQASANWGRSAQATGLALRESGRVAAIGVAGENRVRYATVSADGRHAGRGGLGAVMGSKRLKAIVVEGEHETEVAHPEEVERLARSLRERATGESTAKYRELGTAGNLLTFDRLGVLPTRNFQQSHFEGAAALSAERFRTTRRHRRASCASCTIGCEHRYGFASSTGKKSEVRVEYESLFALGPLCGVDDPDVVLEAAERCDELGIDTISAGATLAFAMECGQKGLVEGGPRFDEPKALLGWLDAIGHRVGFGDHLAEGSRRLAESLGGDAIDFAPQVKGLELPGYEPRALQTMALGFAVGTRGADHNRSGAYEADFSEDADRFHGDERSIRLAVESENRAALIDSLVLCKFVRGALDDFYGDCAALLRAVTGMDFDDQGLRATAERVVNLRKSYNIREGWRPEDDRLPKRFHSEALETGPAAGAHLPAPRLMKMIQGYNARRGWSPDGYLSQDATALLLGTLSLPPHSNEARAASEELNR